MKMSVCFSNRTMIASVRLRKAEEDCRWHLPRLDHTTVTQLKGSHHPFNRSQPIEKLMISKVDYYTV